MCELAELEKCLKGLKAAAKALAQENAAQHKAVRGLSSAFEALRITEANLRLLVEDDAGPSARNVPHSDN